MNTEYYGIELLVWQTWFVLVVGMFIGWFATATSKWYKKWVKNK